MNELESRHKPKHTKQSSDSRAKHNRLSDDKIIPIDSGILQDTSILTTSTGHPEDTIKNADNKHGKKHKKKWKHKTRVKPELSNDMMHEKVRKHKKKSKNKLQAKLEHSNDMTDEKIKNLKQKRTECDTVFDGDTGRVIVIITPPSKALNILKREQKHNCRRRVKRKRKIRSE